MHRNNSPENRFGLFFNRNGRNEGARHATFTEDADTEHARIMEENEIARIVLDATFKIHKKLGPGLLESSYVHCLLYELQQAGLYCEREKVLPLIYENISLTNGYRIDLIVEGRVIIEAKAVSEINDVHVAQLLTYLKLSNCKLGLLLNFNVSLMKNGIRRIVNGL